MTGQKSSLARPRVWRQCAAAICIALASVANAQTDTTTSAKFYLNYDVPESPAFTVLGVTPSTILRGAASKPLVVNLLTSAAQGEKLDPGVALDVAPYAYFGRFRSIKEYHENTLKRLAANSLVSFATIKDSTDNNSLRLGLGLRVTFHDDHDLLEDATLASDLAKLLVPKTIACPKIGDSNICQKGTSDSEEPVDVSAAYDAARERVTKQRGWAISLGLAGAGRLANSVPRPDSLQQRTGRGWLSAGVYLGAGSEILGTFQFLRDTSNIDRSQGGVAYRFHSSTSSISAELAHDSKTGGLLPGLNAEFRLLQRAALVAGIVTDPPTNGSAKRIRFTTAIKWTATEGF